MFTIAIVDGKWWWWHLCELHTISQYTTIYYWRLQTGNSDQLHWMSCVGYKWGQEIGKIKLWSSSYMVASHASLCLYKCIIYMWEQETGNFIITM